MRPWHMAYLAAHPFVGFSKHEGIVPPAPVPVNLPHISFGLLYGSMLFSQPSCGHEEGDELGPGELPFVGRLSDAGLVVPHISFPLNPLLPLTILLGQSNSVFGSSDVKLACHNLLFGDTVQDIACSPIPYFSLGLNLSCFHPYPAPTDMVICPNTVLVGMSLADWITCFIDIAVELAGAAVVRVLGAVAKPLAKKAKNMLGKVKLPTTPAWLSKAPPVQGPQLPKRPPLERMGAIGSLVKPKPPRAKPPLLRQGGKVDIKPKWLQRTGATLKKKWGAAKQGWGTLRKRTADGWGAFKEGTKRNWDELKRGSQRAWESFKNSASKAWDDFAEAMQKRWDDFAEAAKKNLQAAWVDFKAMANSMLPPALRPVGGALVNKYLVGIVLKGGKKMGYAVFSKGNVVAQGTTGRNAAIEVDGWNWDPLGRGPSAPDAPKWSRRLGNEVAGS